MRCQIRSVALLTLLAFASGACLYLPWERRRVRTGLLEELTPVALKNCTLTRFGSAHDGGYLVCENLLQGAEGVYSYGIDTEDNWGCDAATFLKLPVHQYDCFTAARPTCAAGPFVYHNECIGPRAEAIDGKPFDTLEAQIAKNGHAGKRVLVKMDIEGAEWDSLLATPDSVLERIDQMPMELHGLNRQKYLDTVLKLKKTFYVASLHFNNFACDIKAQPMSGWAYQVLLVNKRLAEVDPLGQPHVPGTPPHAPDSPGVRDCQPRVSQRDQGGQRE